MADALEDLLAAKATGTSAPSADPLESLLLAKSTGTASAPSLGNEVRRTSLGEQPPSLADQFKHQLGLTVRAGGTALTALPNMVGDALNSGINLGIRGVNAVGGTDIKPLQMPSQITQNAMTDLGIDQPQNRQERLVQAGTSAMGSTGPSVALGKLLARGTAPMAQAIGTALQTGPTTQAISSAASGASGQGAAEAGLGPAGQIAAAILGGGTTALGMQGAKSVVNSLTAPSRNEMLAAALRDQAENQKPMPRYTANQDGTVTTTLDKPRFKLVDGKPVPAGDLPIPPETPLSPVSPAPQGGRYQTQDQLSNIATLKAIGLDDQRPAVISGDKFKSGMDYENAKLSNPLGLATREQLAKEQTALKNYGTELVQKTGAQATAPEQIGQTIRAPLQKLSEWFDNKVSGVYNAARAKAGDMGPVNPENLNNLLKNSDFRESLLSSQDGTALLGSIERQIKRFQGIPVEGEPVPVAPNTVNSAENLRKWLNSQWSATNSRQLGTVKQALDMDVAQAGGAGVFDQARKLHQLRMNTLDNPNGISKLMNVEGPNGINQAVPDELVAKNLLTMPTGQFQHVVQTLKNLPPELAEYSQRALAEIKGAMAKAIYLAGDSGGTQQGPSLWNAANVNRALNANKSKMAIVFTPEELQGFRTLHDAGYLLQTPTAYKGAAAQGYNYLQSGAMAAPPALGAFLGNMVIPGGIGAAGGASAGTGASMLLKKGLDRSMASKLAEQLRNPTPVFPNE